MEFTAEVKKELLDQIATMKKQLDTLSKEIEDIEKGNALEFIAPIMSAGRIEYNIRCLKTDMEAWSEEGEVYQNVLGE